MTESFMLTIYKLFNKGILTQFSPFHKKLFSLTNDTVNIFYVVIHFENNT